MFKILVFLCLTIFSSQICASQSDNKTQIGTDSAQTSKQPAPQQANKPSTTQTDNLESETKNKKQSKLIPTVLVSAVIAGISIPFIIKAASGNNQSKAKDESKAKEEFLALFNSRLAQISANVAASSRQAQIDPSKIDRKYHGNPYAWTASYLMRSIDSYKAPEKCMRMAQALLGAALGDTLGRLTEFLHTTTAIRTFFGTNSWFTPAYEIGGIYPYTDDTVMAHIVYEVLAEKQNPEWAIPEMAYRFYELLGPKCYDIDPLFINRSHGGRNSTACRNITNYIGDFNKLKPWLDQAPEKAEGGCGSVMRAWPIGFFYDKDRRALFDVADMQSCITHRDPIARAACTAVAVGFSNLFNFASSGCVSQEHAPAIVAKMMIQTAADFDQMEMDKNGYQKCEFFSSETQPDVQFVVNQAKDFIKSNKMLTSDMLRYAKFAAENNIPPEVVLGTHNGKNGFRSTEGFLLGWSADEAAAAALYIFLRHGNKRTKDGFHQAIVEAVNTPGDSDSIATLVGAFMGFTCNENLFELPQVEKLEWYGPMHQLYLQAASLQQARPV